MEDIRKLLNDAEARIAPESLGYVVYGLTCALVDELRDGVPSAPRRTAAALGENRGTEPGDGAVFSGDGKVDREKGGSARLTTSCPDCSI